MTQTNDTPTAWMTDPEWAVAMDEPLFITHELREMWRKARRGKWRCWDIPLYTKPKGDQP